MAGRFAKVSEKEIKTAFFYPSDLVNTKTTIPFRVGGERWIYSGSVESGGYIPRCFASRYISTTIQLPFRGQLYNIYTKKETCVKKWNYVIMELYYPYFLYIFNLFHCVSLLIYNRMSLKSSASAPKIKIVVESKLSKSSEQESVMNLIDVLVSFESRTRVK